MSENKTAKTSADDPEYERGFVDGMQRQMQLHVNRVIKGREMSGDHNMFQKATSYLSGNAFWRTPEEDTPPTGVKMLLLNPGGVCIVGTWADWAVAWAPLPKVPEHIKQLLLERNT